MAEGRVLGAITLPLELADQTAELVVVVGTIATTGQQAVLGLQLSSIGAHYNGTLCKG
jgi:hypothetical protein